MEELKQLLDENQYQEVLYKIKYLLDEWDDVVEKNSKIKKEELIFIKALCYIGIIRTDFKYQTLRELENTLILLNFIYPKYDGTYFLNMIYYFLFKRDKKRVLMNFNALKFIEKKRISIDIFINCCTSEKNLFENIIILLKEHRFIN